MRKITNSVYSFIEDFIHTEELSAFQLDSASPSATHKAFYLRFEHAFKIVSPNWIPDKIYMTVEKTVIKSSKILTPWHGSFVFINKDNPQKQCKIHYYLDDEFKFKLANKLIIETINGEEYVISREYFSDENVQLGEDLPFCLKDLHDTLRVGIQKLRDLILLKSKELLEITQEILVMDTVLAQYLEDLPLLKRDGAVREAAVIHLNAYIEKVNQKNRYLDHSKDLSANMLQTYYHMLQSLSSEPLPSRNFAVDDYIQETTEESTETAIKYEIKQPEIGSQQVIEMLVADVNRLKVQTDSRSMVALHTALEQLVVELIILELENDTPENIVYVNSIRKTLPPDPLHKGTIKEYILAGNLSMVSQIFDSSDLNNIDYVDIFGLLLDQIEEDETRPNIDNLIEVAKYLYSASELYRNYIAVRMTLVCTLGSASGENIQLSLLGIQIYRNNFKAFDLYLSHGANIDTIHSWHGRLGFNAVYTLLLLRPSENFPLDLYLQALIKRGACLNNPYLIMPEVQYIHTDKASSPKKSDTNKVLKQMMFKPSKNNKLKKNLTFVTDFAEPYRYANALEFIWKSYQRTNPKHIESVASHADMHTCLIELLNMLSQNYFLMVLAPSFDGGLAFDVSEKNKEKNINANMKKMSEDGLIVIELDKKTGSMSGFQCQNYTMAAYITVKTSFGTAQERACSLESAQYLYAQFRRLVTVLSDDDKRELAKSMLKRALEAKRTTLLPCIQASYYLGAIVACSLLTTMTLNDYKMLFKLLNWYGQAVFSIAQDPSVLTTIENNTAVFLRNYIPLTANLLRSHLPNFNDLRRIESTRNQSNNSSLGSYRLTGL